tara:strand:- start:281 stop:412 length:132 start_codon:yes stop_codon:yes gene_type:complete
VSHTKNNYATINSNPIISKAFGLSLNLDYSSFECKQKWAIDEI